MSAFDYHEEVSREFATASDYGAVVISGSFLDEILRELLVEFLIPDEKRDKDLFEGHGALSNFSSKIQLCYRLGLISPGEMKLLNTIRGIRNEFAHTPGGISFTTQSIADRCKAISIPEEMITPESIPLPQDDGSIPDLVIEKASSDDPRGLFKEAVMHLMSVLSGRLITAKRERRREPDEYHSATEPREELLRYYEAQLEQYQELLDQRVAVLEQLKEQQLQLNPHDPRVKDIQEELEQLRSKHKSDEDEEMMERHRLIIQLVKYSIEQINRYKQKRQ